MRVSHSTSVGVEKVVAASDVDVSGVQVSRVGEADLACDG